MKLRTNSLTVGLLTMSLMMLGACASNPRQETSSSPETETSSTSTGQGQTSQDQASADQSTQGQASADQSTQGQASAEQGQAAQDQSTQDQSAGQSASSSGAMGSDTSGGSQPMAGGTASSDQSGSSMGSSSGSSIKSMSQSQFTNDLALNRIHHLDQKEIQMAQLALSKSQSPNVKSAAQKILKDHQALDSKVQSLASAQSLQLRSFQPSSYEQLTMDRLKSLSGSQFDQAFMQISAQGHKEAMQDLDLVKDQVQDSQIKSLIDQAKPKLSEHLDMSKKQTQMGGEAGKDQSSSSSSSDSSMSSSGSGSSGSSGSSGQPGQSPSDLQ